MAVCVDLQFACEAGDCPEKICFQRWVRGTLAACDIDEGELSVRLVGMDEGIDLNKRFRGGSTATNVLSFECDAGDVVWPPLLGDVVICLPVCRAEADDQRKPLFAHLAHLVIHGVLHLAGRDHEDEDDAVEMESLESELMSRFGFADPYLCGPDLYNESEPGGRDLMRTGAESTANVPDLIGNADGNGSTPHADGDDKRGMPR